MSRLMIAGMIALAAFGVGSARRADAGTINGNIIATVSDANHKDFEVKVEAASNYTVDKPPGQFDTGLIKNKEDKKPPTNIAGNGTKTVTVTWNIATAKGDNVQAIVYGSTAEDLGKISFTAKFTDPSPVPDLGWQQDASGNVSLVNGDASTIAFSNLGFFVAPDGTLTVAELNAFLAGTLPLTPAAVPSGDIPSGDVLFVGTFSPDAALIAGFDASFVDQSYSTVTAHDGLFTASTLVPEPGTAGVLLVGLLGVLVVPAVSFGKRTK